MTWPKNSSKSDWGNVQVGSKIGEVMQKAQAEAAKSEGAADGEAKAEPADSEDDKADKKSKKAKDDGDVEEGEVVKE